MLQVMGSHDQNKKILLLTTNLVLWGKTRSPGEYKGLYLTCLERSRL